jgi:hypothetical protein
MLILISVAENPVSFEMEPVKIILSADANS